MRACLAAGLLALLTWAVPAAGGEPPGGPAPEEERLQQKRLAYEHENADFYYVRGNYFSALAGYEKVVAAGVEDPEIYYRMGFAARQLRRLQESNEWYGKAAPILEARLEEGGSLADHYLLAALRSSLKPSDPAVREISGRALRRAEKGTYGPVEALPGPDLFRLARLHHFLGQPQQAGQVMERAARRYAESPPDRKDPYVTAVFTERAGAKLASGDHAGAAALYEQLVRIRPRAPGGYYNLGLARLRSGDLAGAAEAWRLAKSNDMAHTSEAPYAEALVTRVLAHTEAHPGEPFPVEAPFAQMGRRQMEEAIAQAVQSLGALYSARAAAEAREAEQEEPAPSESKKRKKQRKRAKKASGDEAAPPQTAPAAPSEDETRRAEAELARALLTYQLKGYPLREIAMQYQLLGFIFRRPPR